MRYVPQLDGVRAICVALTITNHIGPTAWYVNGTLGVDVFFALSGFLITTLLIGEDRTTGRVCLKCFYARRFFRIAPLYYLTIALYAITAYVLFVRGIDLSRLPQMKAAAPAVLIFMGEHLPPAAGTLLGHTWTLGIEEKYYILWPLLFVASRQLRYALRVGLLAAAVLGCWIFLANNGARGYGGIGIGSLLAFVYARNSSQVRRTMVSIPTWVFASAFVLCYMATLATQNSIPSHFALTAVSGLLIVSLVERRSILRNVLSSAPFVFVGKRTYGIYLLHVLVANAVTTTLAHRHLDLSWPIRGALAFAGAVLLASIAKFLLEDPMIDVGRRMARRMLDSQRVSDVAQSEHS
jgi:peptidoglycan/LPS O-acetylase OafA/YrhL